MDVSSRKSHIDEKLLKEQQKLSDLTDSLKKADQLTNNMVNILTQFDERLLKLEETILPVHRKTKDLQRLQDNIERTVTSLDHVISYHHVARDVEGILDKGAGRQVDAYIQSMERLSKAVKFFAENNPDSPELNTVKQLFDKGKDGLESEFKQQLLRQTKPVAAVTLLDMELDQDVERSPAALPDNTVTDLSKIAEWLAGPGASVGFTDQYVAIRSENMARSLSILKDHVRESSLSRGVRKLAVRETPKKANNRRGRMHDRRKEGAGKGSSFATINEDEIVDIEVEPFNEMVTCAVKLFQVEKSLMHRIIPENALKRGVFDNIIKSSLDMIQQDGLKFVQYARQCTLRHDHPAIVNIFPAIKHLKEKQSTYQETLQGVLESSRIKIPQLIGQLDLTGAKVLEEFTDSVKSDPEKESNMPKDGTVHELTSNAMLFMQQLASDMTTSGGMLAAQHNEVAPTRGKNKECLAQYISHVLGALKLNLENKSNVYLDESLAAVFLLNNYDFILTKLNTYGILELAQSYTPDIQKIYTNVIEGQKRKYLASWTKFNVYLSDENKSGVSLNVHSGQKLKDKEKAIVKDKFKSFNNDLEELVRTHRGWSIWSDEIKHQIRSELQNQIVPRYLAFRDKFKLVQFTKNIEKFIKYSESDVREKIESLFDQSAAR